MPRVMGLGTALWLGTELTGSTSSRDIVADTTSPLHGDSYCSPLQQVGSRYVRRY